MTPQIRTVLRRFLNYRPVISDRRLAGGAGLFAALLTIGLASLSVAEEKDEFYDPVEKQLEGWTIKVDPRLLSGETKEVGDKAFRALANHLQRVEYIVPADRLAQLRKLPIWIELNHPKTGNMQFHPDRGWLLANGFDPRLVKHVHIPNAKALYARGTWAKHPYVVLHELAHSYHNQVLTFEHAETIAAFRDAKEKGIYEKVLLYTGRNVRHYALSNHKEYFAESTEAYLGVNDFYPFVRAELKEHDPKMYAVMEAVWGKVR
ncbi:MAG: metallopeptidase [Pirellulaceae bacterium]|nr:metallopeptidase [Pirellulaceae bacterium]